MILHRKIYRWAAIALMLCLPLQVIAAAVIPCLHSAGSDLDGTFSSVCHANNSDADQSQNTSIVTDCQKCALELLLVADLSIATLPLDQSFSVAMYQETASHHFYQLAPHLLQRPPL